MACFNSLAVVLNFDLMINEINKELEKLPQIQTEFAYAYIKRIDKNELLAAQQALENENFEIIDEMINDFISVLESNGYTESIELVEELSARYLN